MATQHVDIQVVPTITASSAYSSGQQLGTLMTLSGVSVAGAEGSFLQKIVIVDKAGQSSAVDVLLFNQQPTVTSSDKQTVSIAAAQMAACSIGNIKITSTTYSAIGSGPSVAAWTAPNMPFPVKPSNLVNPKVNTIYALLVCRGTPTYSSTSDLVLNFHFSWDV